MTKKINSKNEKKKWNYKKENKQNERQMKSKTDLV